MRDILKRIKGGFMDMMIVVGIVALMTGYCWIAAELWFNYGAIAWIMAAPVVLGSAYAMGGDGEL